MSMPHDPTDPATAFAAMCEAVDHGDLESAITLAEEFTIPLDLVWAPEDDFIEPSAAGWARIAHVMPDGFEPPPHPRR